jgi:hypothetical protein
VEASHKKILKGVVIELRHLLEGYYGGAGWHAGDLEQRLNALGVWRDRDPLPIDELARLSSGDREARKVVDAYLKLRADTGGSREEAVAEFVRETAYTWANRLLALRCMEARELIDEVILQKEVYGGRSLEHNRLAQRHPEQCVGDDDGLFIALDSAFTKQAENLPLLFDPRSPGVSLKPGIAALKRAIAMLSGKEGLRGQDPASAEVFRAPDAFGWAYQYWNIEEKDRVFERIRTQRGAKIEGADIIPATQLYTEPYMVRFLVQNSLGALWASMNHTTKLSADWEYYVHDADRVEAERKPVCKITFVDPACGSGHFLLEAFDLFYDMYEEEGEIIEPEAICRSILEHNLYGIDIDGRAIQISESVLWMKAAERLLQKTGSTSFRGIPVNLVATNIRLPRGIDHLQAFLGKHPEDRELSSALETVFDGLQNADELGSLLQIEGPVETKLKELQQHREKVRMTGGVQSNFFKATPIQGRLPIGVESYEHWKENTLARLKQHFRDESEATDLGEAFFSRSAQLGLKLLDVLARRYDVIATNPPFMGSKSMPPEMKAYVAKRYPQGKRDLLAAFILRALELAIPGSGRAALVSQQTTLLLKSYAALRGADSASFPGLLRSQRVEVIAQLGSGAFAEIGGVVVSPILVVLQASHPLLQNRLVGIRTMDCTSPAQKANRLKLRCRDPLAEERYKPLQATFLAMDRTPIAFWLPQTILDLFLRNTLVGDHAFVRQGICTTHNQRFLRYEWEVQNQTSRWFHAAKGGGYGKWIGFDKVQIDWQYNGSRVKRFQEDNPGAIHWSGRMPADTYFFRKGWTYSNVSPAIGMRLIDEMTLFLHTAPIAIPKLPEELHLVGGLLNSRTASYLARSLTQDVKIQEGYVQRIPWPSGDAAFEAHVTELVKSCVALKCEMVAFDPTEHLFDPCRVKDRDRSRYQLLSALLTCLEFELDRSVAKSYGLAEPDLNSIYDQTGAPAGSYPLLKGYSTIRARSSERELEFLGIANVDNAVQLELSHDEIKSLKYKVRQLYKEESTAGSSENNDENDDAHDDEEDEDIDLSDGQVFKVPSESKIEEISQQLKIHPLSVYLLLLESFSEGWRSIPELRELSKDRITVLLLRLLGHHWATQIEGRVPINEFADGESIIALTEDSKRRLLDRARERIKTEFDCADTAAFEQDFAEIVGLPLDHWITREFFEHHSRQFKKRPIAWQIQSSPFSARRTPAFCALVYYQTLSMQSLPTVQSQFVRPLRQRYESELRGIESLPQNARSERQQDRQRELADTIDELRVFDEALEAVSRCGFCPEKLYPQLRQYAVEDAILCLKSQWLDKLSGIIAAGPVKSWQIQAQKSNLHPSLSEWLEDAMAHLRYHSPALGPKAPRQDTFEADPTAADLAQLISADAAKMVGDVLELACTAWWCPLEDTVFESLRSKCKDAKNELKQLRETDLGKAQHPSVSCNEIVARAGELKESIKRWERDLKEQIDIANKLRNGILTWRSPEVLNWQTWLSSQPMYDTISSLDGVRQPPQTLAEWVAQESTYAPDINDGVRVNIAPLQKAGLIVADVLAGKDVDKAIADRAEWRADERRWCREGKLPQPGWWHMEKTDGSGQD